MRLTRRVIWTLSAVCLAGIACVAALGLFHQTRVPDLRRLYASGMEPVREPPVIIIPGILGSRLRDRASGSELWPGTLYNVLFSAGSLALKIDRKTLEPLGDDVEAYDLF